MVVLFVTRAQTPAFIVSADRRASVAGRRAVCLSAGACRSIKLSFMRQRPSAQCVIGRFAASRQTHRSNEAPNYRTSLRVKEMYRLQFNQRAAAAGVERESDLYMEEHKRQQRRSATSSISASRPADGALRLHTDLRRVICVAVLRGMWRRPVFCAPSPRAIEWEALKR